MTNIKHTEKILSVVLNYEWYTFLYIEEHTDAYKLNSKEKVN